MTSSLQPELDRKIAAALFQEEATGPVPFPTTWPARLAWLGEIGTAWLSLGLAIANLALALFDYSYLELRHMYLETVPGLVTLYDPVKGIAPHRTTKAYLAHAEETFKAMKRWDAKAYTSLAAITMEPVTHPDATTSAMLADMQERSVALIQEDPFIASGQAGIFERAKNLMRRHMGVDSAKLGFTRFWTQRTLNHAWLEREIDWFNSRIRPLIARNYYRRTGENGLPFDAFWMIDLLFLPFFALEFVLRGWHLRRTRRVPSWKAYTYSRWYDLGYLAPIGLSLVPFGSSGWIHLLRAISVGNRMSRLGLFNPIAFTQAYTNRIVNLLTDLVSVRLIGNYQESIRSFDLEKTIHAVSPEQRDQIRRVIEQHVEGMVVRVLPAIASELEAVITYSAKQALHASPAYQQLCQLPFVGNLPDRYLPDLVAEVVSGTQRTLSANLRDPEYQALVDRVVKHAARLLYDELATLRTEDELKRFLFDALEQQKQKLLS